MTQDTMFEAIIIGGSYAGLSAAMALGRSLRKVLIVDSGNPCNKQTPFSHNFITQDGKTPGEITEAAKAQVLQYGTVNFLSAIAVEGQKTETGFAIKTDAGDTFAAKKLLFATGVADQLPNIEEFAACWGISVLHCPYCHGYEVRHQNIGLLGNGEVGFELCRLLSHWTQKLTLFTNGKSTLTDAQTEKVNSHSIEIVENEIVSFGHSKGHIQNLIFSDHSTKDVSAVFARVAFKQHCDIPLQMGCELTEQGLLKVDDFHKTSVHGIFAAGDNSILLRAVSVAVAAGTKAGAFLNKELIDEAF